MLMRTAPSILVVDDEPAIRDFLEDVLQDEGYRVYVATDGRKALDALQPELPDFVLTDLMMPDIDVRALAAHLRAAPITAHIPIVLVSAAYIPQDDDRFAAVLHKPFQLDERKRQNSVHDEIAHKTILTSDLKSRPHVRQFPHSAYEFLVQKGLILGQ